MNDTDIEKYIVAPEGKPWVPWRKMSSEEKEMRRRRADKIAEEWRKAVDGNSEAEAYYTELAKGRQ